MRNTSLRATLGLMRAESHVAALLAEGENARSIADATNRLVAPPADLRLRVRAVEKADVP